MKNIYVYKKPVTGMPERLGRLVALMPHSGQPTAQLGAGLASQSTMASPLSRLLPQHPPQMAPTYEKHITYKEHVSY